MKTEDDDVVSDAEVSPLTSAAASNWPKGSFYEQGLEHPPPPGPPL